MLCDADAQATDCVGYWLSRDYLCVLFKSNLLNNKGLLQVAKTLDTVRIKPTSITCIHG